MNNNPRLHRYVKTLSQMTKCLKLPSWKANRPPRSLIHSVAPGHEMMRRWQCRILSNFTGLCHWRCRSRYPWGMNEVRWSYGVRIVEIPQQWPAAGPWNDSGAIWVLAFAAEKSWRFLYGRDAWRDAERAIWSFIIWRRVWRPALLLQARPWWPLGCTLASQMHVLRIWIGQQTDESIVLYTPCGSTYNLVSPSYIWFYCMRYSLC